MQYELVTTDQRSLHSVWSYNFFLIKTAIDKAKFFCWINCSNFKVSGSFTSVFMRLYCCPGRKWSYLPLYLAERISVWLIIFFLLFKPGVGKDPARETILCGPPAVTEIYTRNNRTSEDFNFLLFTDPHGGKQSIWERVQRRIKEGGGGDVENAFPY